MHSGGHNGAVITSRLLVMRSFLIFYEWWAKCALLRVYLFVCWGVCFVLCLLWGGYFWYNMCNSSVWMFSNLVHLSIYLFMIYIHLFISTYLSIYLSMYGNMYVCAYLFVSVYLPIYLPICSSVYLSMCIHECVSSYLSIHSLCICVSKSPLYIHTYPYIHFLTSPSIK